MENFFEKNLTVLSSIADAEGRMSIPALFDLYMDLAAEHAERLGVGFREMAERRAFWVAVRTRVRIHDRPALMETVHARTWPGKPGSVKCDRFYYLRGEKGILAEGRTEWVGQNMDTGRVMKTDAYGYPAQMEHLEDRVCEAPFTRFREQPLPENLLMTYAVTSRDIDIGHHMNNVAYVRLLMSTFSVSELEAMDIQEIEVAYSMACLEGEELGVYRRRDDEGWYFLVSKPDGATAMQAVIRLRQ